MPCITVGKCFRRLSEWVAALTVAGCMGAGTSAARVDVVEKVGGDDGLPLVLLEPTKIRGADQFVLTATWAEIAQAVETRVASEPSQLEGLESRVAVMKSPESGSLRKIACLMRLIDISAYSPLELIAAVPRNRMRFAVPRSDEEEAVLGALHEVWSARLSHASTRLEDLCLGNQASLSEASVTQGERVVLSLPEVFDIALVPLVGMVAAELRTGDLLAEKASVELSTDLLIAYASFLEIVGMMERLQVPGAELGRDPAQMRDAAGCARSVLESCVQVSSSLGLRQFQRVSLIARIGIALTLGLSMLSLHG